MADDAVPNDAPTNGTPRREPALVVTGASDDVVGKLVVDDAIRRIVRQYAPSSPPVTVTEPVVEMAQESPSDVAAAIFASLPRPIHIPPTPEPNSAFHHAPLGLQYLSEPALIPQPSLTPVPEVIAPEPPAVTVTTPLRDHAPTPITDVVMPALVSLPEPKSAPAHTISTPTDIEEVAKPSNAQWLWQSAKTGVRVAGYVAVGWLALMAVVILLYRFVNPPMSSLMIQKAVMGTSIKQTWQPLERISPNLVRAVVVSEDWRFCNHYGIDLKEIEAAIARSRNGIPRGASTMTMQLAKNLFLWPAKSYFRKALEVPLTLMLELMLPKRRIAEIYLNIVEWGPGIFGAEAAARHHFKKPAAKLNTRQAALLAVALPSPIRRKAGAPRSGHRRMASTIQARMRQVGTAVSCILRR